MFSHIVVGSNDLNRSKLFYDALFAAVGGSAGTISHGRLRYVHNGGVFIVTRPIDGRAATHANGGTIGFAMTGPEEVDAWHAAGAAHGGTPVEDPPGLRDMGGLKLYLAYLRDPDGNKLCASHR